MKFLLVSLNWDRLVSKKSFKIHFTLPPLDLINLGNLISQRGDNFHILDLFVDSLATINSNFNDYDWIIVTTTPYHMWQCPNSEWDKIKESLAIFPKHKTIVAGLHSSVFPEKTLRETGVFAVIRREPESVFNNFFSTQEWHATDGISFLRNGEYVQNPDAKLMPMNQIILNTYPVDINKYGYFLLGKKTGVFESSRGCPWKCTFCDQEMYSWRYRAKSPAQFAEEVNLCIETTGMKSAYFYDLEFTFLGSRTLEIAAELIKRNVQKKIKWACQTRADMIDEQILDALKESGCKLIHFGVESANPDVLLKTQKKISIKTIESGIRLAKAKGFETACFFMFGLPGETASQFDNTLEFARSLNPTYASFHFAIPFPGTPLYEEYLKERNLESGCWPSTYFNDWSHDKISSYIRHAYRSFYMFPKKFEFKEFAYRINNFTSKYRYFKSF